MHISDEPTPATPFTTAAFSGNVVMLGSGSLGQGVLPLLLRHLRLAPASVLVVSPGNDGLHVARELGVQTLSAQVTPDNMAALLRAHLRPGDLLLNLAVDVSSVALIAWCQDAGVVYLDADLGAWPCAQTDPRRSPAERSTHALRRSALALRARSPDGPTAVLGHGANPGLVSHFVKQALLDLARDLHGYSSEGPTSREGWARLAQRLGVRAIHITERDSQSAARRRKANEFVNTWSVQALHDQASRPAELGWGTHELHFPTEGARHAGEPASGIYLMRPGAEVRVRSWTQAGGPMHGHLMAQPETLSIADHLTIGDPLQPQYRPTVLCAYRPSDDAELSLQELAEHEGRLPIRRDRLCEEILTGMVELGVLLVGHPRGAYWYGSRLGIDEARAACPHNNATTLQAAAGVVAGVAWALEHPYRGIVEPDALPFDQVLGLCRPYLGTLVGQYTDWTPLAGRQHLFREDIDANDPWQFKNLRVA